MEKEGRNISALARQYQEKLMKVTLPEMNAEDLLDLVDYYTRCGMDFEAELYKRIAQEQYPDHPEVALLSAHWEADDGNWAAVESFMSKSLDSTYDAPLFRMEKLLRIMRPEWAMEYFKKRLNPCPEDVDYDFMFDAAELFRDFGRYKEALEVFDMIPTTYLDYSEVLELKAECYYYLMDYDQSLAMLDQAIDRNSFDDYLWTQTALVNYAKGNYDASLEACEYALAVRQDNPRALYIKELLHWHSDNDYDITNEMKMLQDEVAMMEVGDLHLSVKDYLSAEEDYMLAGLFCARSSRERSQIIFKTACLRIVQGKAESGVQVFLSMIGHNHDLSAYASHLLFLLLYTRACDQVSVLLHPLLHSKHVSVYWLDSIVFQLVAAGCYYQIESVWRELLSMRSKISEKMQPFLDEAEKILDGPR